MNKDYFMSKNSGLLCGLSAYILWGILPLYWKWLSDVDAIDILFYRIIWSLAFMILYLLVTRSVPSFIKEAKTIMRNKKGLLLLIAASVLITINWGIYIYTIAIGHVQEASLGYYINPLFNMFVGVIYLKEPFTRRAKIASGLALVGVILLTIQTGVFPFASILLAASFCLYGLVKKRIQLTTTSGLTLETLMIFPVAILYLLFFSKNNFMGFDSVTNLLIIGAGIVTAIPLLLFSYAAKKISYVTLGFAQYINPTIVLLLSIFLFHEPYGFPKFTAFSFIWLGIAVFILGNVLEKKRWNIGRN